MHRQFFQEYKALISIENKEWVVISVAQQQTVSLLS
jgi:hypothetical protein